VPGRGSLFYLFQPLTEDAPPTSLPDETLHEATLNPHHILVVEDDPNVRMALSQLMAQWGVGADFAATDEEALALVSEGSLYTMALVDYRLPGSRTGIDVILEIREQHAAPQPQIYLVTGDMDPEILALADARNIQVLHKPLHPSRLRQLLGRG
jgi:CheY-like chemotaxis protein